jgi:carboxylesterase 2
VQKNIAQLGGGPTTIMIFGESTGGESIKQRLASPSSPLPFSLAILEYEQAFLIGNGATNYQNVSNHFGCTTIQCLRNVPATDLKAYIEANSLAFPPVNGDGTGVGDVRPSISFGKFAEVSIMLGINLNEARVFLAVVDKNNGTAVVDGVLADLGLNSTAAQQNIILQYTSDIVNDLYLLADW